MSVTLFGDSTKLLEDSEMHPRDSIALNVTILLVCMTLVGAAYLLLQTADPLTDTDTHYSKCVFENGHIRVHVARGGDTMIAADQCRKEIHTAIEGYYERFIK